MSIEIVERDRYVRFVPKAAHALQQLMPACAGRYCSHALMPAFS
jgi:hypothetical protein